MHNFQKEAIVCVQTHTHKVRASVKGHLSYEYPDERERHRKHWEACFCSISDIRCGVLQFSVLEHQYARLLPVVNMSLRKLASDSTLVYYFQRTLKKREIHEENFSSPYEVSVA